MVIHTQGFRKTYHPGKTSKQVVAVRSLDLQVPRNSIFGFIGPNGAGKSTTIKLLLGLVQPTGGTASILGYDVARQGLEIRKRIGYLPQNPRFYDHMTARETLRFKARFFYSGPAAGVEDRVSEMIKLVGLENKADRPIKSLSGGEQQRLGIAQAQVNYPELLILDEPAASLDPLGRRDVLDVMKRLQAHTTIFFSTHILDDVQQVSDTVAIMNEGALLAQAPIQELLAGSRSGVYLLTLEGDPRAAQSRVESQGWVAGLTATPQEGLTKWEVRVTDDQVAKSLLPRLVLEDPSVYLLEFRRMNYELEDVFLEMITRDQNGR
jgi:ABC-2 type transport system ATP-binding protein